MASATPLTAFTAFTARPIVELKARDKSRVQSLVAYGDRLFVGLHTGVLRIYRVNEEGAAAADGPTHLLREVEKFASRSIDQLAIIKEANTLVSLANYAVSLHDLQSFAPLPGAAPLPGTKNASAFAVTSNIVKDPVTGIPEIVSRLAVAVKRRLLLWTWFASELSTGAAPPKTPDDKDGKATPPPEIVLPETIRSVTWASATKLVVGMNAGYVLVDVLERTLEDIGTAGSEGDDSEAGSGGVGANDFGSTSRFGALSSASMGYMGLGSYMPKPMATKLADGAVLLAKDVHTLFVSDKGRTLNRRPIPWPTAPESVGYSYPYILSLASGGTSTAAAAAATPPTPIAGTLEVRNPDTLSLLQTIELPVPGGSTNTTTSGPLQLHVPPPSVSLAHAGKGFHVSSERGVWKMDATAYDDQIEALVAAGRLDEAISVLGLLEDALLGDKKAQTLRSVKMLKAEQLFRQRKYLASMDLFNEEDVHAPPERVLRFFPRSIVGELSEEPEEEDDTEEEEGGAAVDADKSDKSDKAKSDKGETDEAKGETETNGEGKQHEQPGPATATATATTATITPTATPPPEQSYYRASGFTKMFLGPRRANSDAASIPPASPAKSAEEPAKSATTEASTAAGTTATTTTTTADGPVRLEGKELMRAAEALNSYLAGTRARLQREIDPATGKLKERKSVVDTDVDSIAHASANGDQKTDEEDEAREKRLRETFTLVDTTMFRVLMLIRPKLASSLFRIPNFCDPAVVNERLLASSRYNELVDFFYGKRLHRQALELLRRFGGEAAAAAEAEAEAEAEAKTDVTIPPALRGPRRTVAYLQSLPPEMADLVLEFSAWTLRADPVLGMDVFLADSENAETLPRDRVARFLGDIDAKLEIQYLEHVIKELNDLTPDFHNRLIEQWIQQLKAEQGTTAEAQAAWETNMDKLVLFLKTSRQYSLSRTFAQLPRDEAAFYEAQAVVLSNMGQHKQALEIYVFKMKDTAKAEEYCNRIHAARDAVRTATQSDLPVSPRLAAMAASDRRSLASVGDNVTLAGSGRESREEMAAAAGFGEALRDDDDESSVLGGSGSGSGSPASIYHTLLSLYLTPPPPYNGTTPQLEPALDLLSRHGARLPASSTLRLIPETLPVAQLEAYFRGRMRAAHSAVHASRIEKGLRQTGVLAAQASLLLGEDGDGRAGRSRHVVVGEERACGVCHKRLGGSVVAVLADNAVVHYGCLSRAGGRPSRPSWQGRRE